MQVAVDIGGTFTDVVGRSADGGLRYFKIPTTRSNESLAVLESIQRIQDEWKVAPGHIRQLVHGTTVATNAVLERKGATVGIITTEGFKDVLAIGRQMRHRMYDVILESETPEFLAPGRRRKEVRGRIAADGSILTPLDEAAVVQAADELVADGVDAIAICLLFSFANPVHEQRARDLIAQKHPGVALAISHEVDPVFREYERTVVTSFDVYVKPVIDRYLSRLESGLGDSGVQAPLQVMQSRGGLMASGVARRRPVRLFLSGPAAGVVGARIVGGTEGIDDLITVDIGGTSSDIALIEGGRALIRAEGRIDGYPLRVPMVDVNSIGAGGGSIAWLDAAGGLRVGPHSAGSEPGPACYGRGGEEPTVTDASVVLGYIDPQYFSGGALTLEPERARAVIQQKIAGPLGMTVEEAALGIHRIVNTQMAEGIRLVSIQQGLDPRKFTLMPLGGGGAIHATALARELGIARVVIPRYPGVLAAAGLLAAPIEHEAVAAYGRELAGLDLDDLRKALAALDQQCTALMQSEEVGIEQVHVQHYADVCYIGQGYTLAVPFSPEGPDVAGTLYEDFVATHNKVYGYAPRNPARVVNLRTVHRAGGRDSIDSSDYAPVRPGAAPGTRRIRVAGSTEPVEAAVYKRDTLAPGTEFTGPAIVEQSDTTIVIEPGWHVRTAATGNLLLSAPQGRG